MITKCRIIKDVKCFSSSMLIVKNCVRSRNCEANIKEAQRNKRFCLVLIIMNQINDHLTICTEESTANNSQLGYKRSRAYNKSNVHILDSDEKELCGTKRNLLIRLDVIFSSDIITRKKKCCSFNPLYVKVC